MMANDIIVYIIVFTVLALIIFVSYQARLREAEIQRQLEIERQLKYEADKAKFLETVSIASKKIGKAKSEFNLLINFDSGYFNFMKCSLWKLKYNQLHSDCNNFLSSEFIAFYQNSELLREYVLLYDQTEKIRFDYNKQYIEHEKKKHATFFSDFEGAKLDSQQIEALISDEDNNIIIAGAGTGKTKTIAAKVAFLVKHKNVNPNDILLMSFTKDSCSVMVDRIKNKLGILVDVKTFNKLGLDIIKEVEDINQKSVLDLSKKEISTIFDNYLKFLQKNQNYQKLLIDYFSFYLKPYKADNEFKSESERFQYIKDQKYFGYKKIQYLLPDGTPIEYREKLKSFEEVEIANFLFLNDIEYKYEGSFECRTASKVFGQYKPDFYLPKYKIYIEHFGIDKNGNVAPWFNKDGYESASEKYNAGIEWKREIHLRNNTKMIETYSWEKSENKLLTNLAKKLRDNGVVFTEKSDTEKWKIIKEAEEDGYQNFVELLYTYLTLLKSNNYTIEYIDDKIRKGESGYHKLRNISFLTLFKPIYNLYQSMLSNENKIDFSDMINHATEYVSSGDIKLNYKYIIIDEFQDVSIGRYSLIKSILNQNPECKLFCVGDDWQSIYRFTGSDIAIFNDFNNYFNDIGDYKRGTKTMRIETTYRFKSDILNLSSSFIKVNPNQSKKTLKSKFEDTSKSYSFVYYDYKNKDSFANSLKKVIAEIQNNSVHTKRVSVLLLGRYNNDIKFIENTGMFKIQFVNNNVKITSTQEYNIDFDFKSIHKAKGTEADYVIFLNCNSGKYGFPSEIADDPVLNLLLTNFDQFPNGEERRVFYVGLTRAKKCVYFIVNSEIKSKFISEIELIENPLIGPFCPWCGDGILERKTGKYGLFERCTNYPCNYTGSISEKELDIVKVKDKVINVDDLAF